MTTEQWRVYQIRCLPVNRVNKLLSQRQQDDGHQNDTQTQLGMSEQHVHLTCCLLLIRILYTGLHLPIHWSFNPRSSCPSPKHIIYSLVTIYLFCHTYFLHFSAPIKCIFHRILCLNKKESHTQFPTSTNACTQSSNTHTHTHTGIRCDCVWLQPTIYCSTMTSAMIQMIACCLMSSTKYRQATPRHATWLIQIHKMENNTSLTYFISN